MARSQLVQLPPHSVPMTLTVPPFRARRIRFGCAIALAAAVGGSSLAGALGRPAGRDFPTVGAEALPPADPRTVPGYGADPVSLLGPSRLTAEQLAASVTIRHETHLTVTIDELARLYIEEGEAFGVRADLAWTQSIVETGWFTFPSGGLVKPANNNFAGMGACDSCSDGNRYADARTGVRAQMAAIRQYADPVEVDGALNRPPESYWGVAPTWREMGNGHWATSTRYADTILSVYGRLLADHGLTLDYVPPPAREPEPAVRPRRGDGLFLAGIDGQIYDVGDARFWGSAVNRTLRSRVAAVVPTPTVEGYWLVTAGGGVLGFGDAEVDADAVGRFAAPIVGAAATPLGRGFWAVSRSGEVVGLGDAAAIAPAPGAIPADAAVVGIAPTPTGLGYWLVDSAGRVYPVGDAPDLGGMRVMSAIDQIAGITATPLGDGYWLVTSRGRVHAFGAAVAHGGLLDEIDAQLVIDDFASLADLQHEARTRALAHPIVAIASTPTGGGYWLVTVDGWVVGRGDAADFGDATPGGEAIVGATARR